MKTLTTDQALFLMTRYLGPLLRSPPDNMHLAIELDEVVRLMDPEFEVYFRWSIDTDQLAAGIKELSSLISVEVSDWDSSDGERDFGGYLIELRLPV